jgi:hypothetical protein
MTSTLLTWHVTFADGHTSALTVESCRVPYHRARSVSAIAIDGEGETHEQSSKQP